MVDRRLVLTVEGAPVCYGAFAGDIRSAIMSYSDDFAELLSVWSIPSSNMLLASPAEEITERFAIDWSKEFDFADGPNSTDAMALFPAFVREAAEDHLMKAWMAALEEKRERTTA